jgi:hypothetical protein
VNQERKWTVIKMDVNSIAEKMKSHIGEKTAIALWEMHSMGGSSDIGFCFRSVFQVTGVVKKNERVKIIVNVELIDCWELFEEKARKIFLEIIRGEISNQIQGIENIDDILDIVIES